MKNALHAAYYREIAKAARRLEVLVRDLDAPARDDLQLATLDSGGARGDAIRCLLDLAKRLNSFAAGSVALDEVMAYGIVPDDRPR